MPAKLSIAARLVGFAAKHRELSESEIWAAFLAQVISDTDACREALDFWWALNHRRLLGLKSHAEHRTADDRDSAVKSKTAKAATKILLMQVVLPTGKMLAESTGAECTQAGGWLARVGMHVGPTGIVGEMLDEAKLRELLTEVKAKKRGASKESTLNA